MNQFVNQIKYGQVKVVNIKGSENNGIEMYSRHNEGKSVIAERFIRTFKNKIQKYMTPVSKTCIFLDR